MAEDCEAVRKGGLIGNNQFASEGIPYHTSNEKDTRAIVNNDPQLHADHFAGINDSIQVAEGKASSRRVWGEASFEGDVTAYYVVGLTPAVNAEDDAHTLLLERGNCGVAGKDVTGTKWGWKEVGILGEVGSVNVDLGIRIDDAIIV